MKNGRCPKCDCTIILQGVRVLDRVRGAAEYDLEVATYSTPDAWLIKGKVTGKLWACVCGACGFTELYATNLDALVRAAAEAQERKSGANDGAT